MTLNTPRGVGCPSIPVDTEERAIRAPLSKSETRWSTIEMMIWSGPFGRGSGRALFAVSEFVCRWWCLCLYGGYWLCQNGCWGPNRNLACAIRAEITKMANTAVVIARCIVGNHLANIARSHSRDSIVSRRCPKPTPDASSRQRAKPLLQIWSQWVENWTVLTITV